MEWIHIGDRLPKDYLIVQGKNEEGEMFRCCLIDGIWEDDTIDSLEQSECMVEITHWSPNFQNHLRIDMESQGAVP